MPERLDLQSYKDNPIYQQLYSQLHNRGVSGRSNRIRTADDDEAQPKTENRNLKGKQDRVNISPGALKILKALLKSNLNNMESTYLEDFKAASQLASSSSLNSITIPPNSPPSITTSTQSFGSTASNVTPGSQSPGAPVPTAAPVPFPGTGNENANPAAPGWGNNPVPIPIPGYPEGSVPPGGAPYTPKPFIPGEAPGNTDNTLPDGIRVPEPVWVPASPEGAAPPSGPPVEIKPYLPGEGMDNDRPVGTALQIGDIQITGVEYTKDENGNMLSATGQVDMSSLGMGSVQVALQFDEEGNVSGAESTSSTLEMNVAGTTTNITGPQEQSPLAIDRQGNVTVSGTIQVGNQNLAATFDITADNEGNRAIQSANFTAQPDTETGEINAQNQNVAAGLNNAFAAGVETGFDAMQLMDTLSNDNPERLNNFAAGLSNAGNNLSAFVSITGELSGDERDNFLTAAANAGEDMGTLISGMTAYFGSGEAQSQFLDAAATVASNGGDVGDFTIGAVWTQLDGEADLNAYYSAATTASAAGSSDAFFSQIKDKRANNLEH